MEIPTLTISCQGAVTFGLDELNDMQGDLKDLSEEHYVKLRNSMLTYGFSFPIFTWNDNGKIYILDAHQRIRTLRKMRDEGIVIPPLPADIIFAANKVEAKKKLLLLNSRYGKITREGFDAFIDEPGFEVGDDIEELLVIPEVEYFDEPSNEGNNDGGNPQKTREIVCPACQHTFTLFNTKEE